MTPDVVTPIDPGFAEPIWLGVGLLAVVALLLLELGARRRRAQALRLFAASHLMQTLTGSISPFRRALKSVLLVSATALLFIALARPHLYSDWREESRSGLDILVAVDCSKSMLSEDVKPSRLERAKLALSDFGDHLVDNRLGLIAFAGDAFLQCPLTIDHEAFQNAVRELDTDTIPKPGTDVSTAIDQALLALKSQPNNMKFLILITDGEDLEGRVLDSAREAAKQGLKIFTVGVGTPAGGLIPQRDETGAEMYLHDSSGQIVQSKLDENTLKQIASITGGAYVPLGQRGEGLEEIYNQYIAPLPKQHFEERREKVPVDCFEYPLGLAVFFLICEFLINDRIRKEPASLEAAASRAPVRRRRKPALAVTSLIALSVLGGSFMGNLRAASTATAEESYKSGQYQAALEHYREAAQSQPDRSDLQFNRGDAAYKAGEYSEAEEAFRKSLETPDLGLQEKSYYNLGNSQFKHGEAMESADKKKTIDMWEQALKSYESSMKLEKTADAKHNYDVVKERLEQLKQQQQQQQQQQKQDKDNQSKSDQNKQDQQNQQNPSKQDQQKKDQKPQDQKQQGQGQGQGQNDPNQQPPQDPSQKPGEQNKQDDPSKQDPSKQDPSKQDQQKPQDQNGQQPQASQGKNPTPSDAQRSAYSQGRAQDKEDPGVKSRAEAEALLDSLKDDEKHVTARTLNSRNDPPPPPPSGKDW